MQSKEYLVGVKLPNSPVMQPYKLDIYVYSGYIKKSLDELIGKRIVVPTTLQGDVLNLAVGTITSTDQKVLKQYFSKEAFKPAIMIVSQISLDEATKQIKAYGTKT